MDRDSRSSRQPHPLSCPCDPKPRLNLNDSCHGGSSAASNDSGLLLLLPHLLLFIPDGLREENITLGAFESRFQQPFGRFEGTLKLQGQTVRVTGLGVTEQHWATW
jgi:Protein of unknown function (DUF2804)